MPKLHPKAAPSDQRGSLLDRLLTSLSKTTKEVRNTFLRHQNILENRITSLEKRRYELTESYTATLRELDYQLNLLRIQRANARAKERTATQRRSTEDRQSPTV